MNVASFYDLDGDGTIDYEVWANLNDTGWAGSYLDDKTRVASYNEESQVIVTVDGSDVVLRFPLAHLRGATTLRWSTASEWGRYETLSTDLAARDDAPDDDAPASFPR